MRLPPRAVALLGLTRPLSFPSWPPGFGGTLWQNCFTGRRFHLAAFSSDLTSVCPHDSSQCLVTHSKGEAAETLLWKFCKLRPHLQGTSGPWPPRPQAHSHLPHRAYVDLPGSPLSLDTRLFHNPACHNHSLSSSPWLRAYQHQRDKEQEASAALPVRELGSRRLPLPGPSVNSRSQRAASPVSGGESCLTRGGICDVLADLAPYKAPYAGRKERCAFCLVGMQGDVSGCARERKVMTRVSQLGLQALRSSRYSTDDHGSPRAGGGTPRVMEHPARAIVSRRSTVLWFTSEGTPLADQRQQRKAKAVEHL